MAEEKKNEEEVENDEDRPVKFIPTIDYYHRTYANSMGYNDIKACKIFKEFESAEKLRRLKTELISVKDNKVIITACDNVIKKKRKVKHQGYDRWAQLMLLWLNQK